VNRGVDIEKSSIGFIIQYRLKRFACNARIIKLA